jgi:hypothetical protein
MPDAPAPTLRLVDDENVLARAAAGLLQHRARWKAVDRPWTPAPMIAYLTPCGSAIDCTFA